MTFDRSQVNDADAIVFHMTRNDFSWTDIPKYRHINQRYVFLSQETPLNSYIDTLNHIPGSNQLLILVYLSNISRILQLDNDIST